MPAGTVSRTRSVPVPTRPAASRVERVATGTEAYDDPLSMPVSACQTAALRRHYVVDAQMGDGGPRYRLARWLIFLVEARVREHVLGVGVDVAEPCVDSGLEGCDDCASKLSVAIDVALGDSGPVAPTPLGLASEGRVLPDEGSHLRAAEVADQAVRTSAHRGWLRRVHGDEVHGVG